jgi:hypothetical protein
MVGRVPFQLPYIDGFVKYPAVAGLHARGGAYAAADTGKRRRLEEDLERPVMLFLPHRLDEASNVDAGRAAVIAGWCQMTTLGLPMSPRALLDGTLLTGAVIE